MSQSGTNSALGIPTQRFMAISGGQIGVGAAPVDMVWSIAGAPGSFSRNFPALEGAGTTFVLSPNVLWLLEAFVNASNFSDAVNGTCIAVWVDQANVSLNAANQGVQMVSIGTVGIDPDVNPTARLVRLLIRPTAEQRVKLRLDAFTGTLDIVSLNSWVSVQPLI